MTAPSAPEDVTSRFRVTEKPLLSPGHCAVCGAADRPVVDFGTNVQFYGNIMLCGECVCEAASKFGMVPTKELEESKVQTGQSIEGYLLQRNLKVVSGELYDAFVTIVSRLLDGTLPDFGYLDSSADPEDEGSGEPVPGQLSIVFSDDESDGSESKSDSEPFDL